MFLVWADGIRPCFRAGFACPYRMNHVPHVGGWNPPVFSGRLCLPLQDEPCSSCGRLNSIVFVGADGIRPYFRAGFARPYRMNHVPCVGGWNPPIFSGRLCLPLQDEPCPSCGRLNSIVFVGADGIRPYFRAGFARPYRMNHVPHVGGWNPPVFSGRLCLPLRDEPCPLCGRLNSIVFVGADGIRPYFRAGFARPYRMNHVPCVGGWNPPVFSGRLCPPLQDELCSLCGRMESARIFGQALPAPTVYGWRNPSSIFRSVFNVTISGQLQF